jgi:FXSXX-COOH protein
MPAGPLADLADRHCFIRIFCAKVQESKRNPEQPHTDEKIPSTTVVSADPRVVVTGPPGARRGPRTVTLSAGPSRPRSDATLDRERGGLPMQDVVGDRAAVEPGESQPVDVTGLPLAELLSSEDTVLSNALRRLLRDMADPQEIIAGWQSYHP